MRRKIKKPTLLVLVAILMACGAVVILSLPKGPGGHYASHAYMPHDDSDVLTFSNGTVLWLTMCGNECVGSYRDTNGRWIWNRPLTKQNRTNTFVLKPGLFTIECIDARNPTVSFSMRRRRIKPGSDGE